MNGNICENHIILQAREIVSQRVVYRIFIATGDFSGVGLLRGWLEKRFNTHLPCKPSDENADVGDEYPGFSKGN